MNVTFFNTLQMLFGLAIVAGAIVAAAWCLRRFVTPIQGTNAFFKPFASASLGPRERIVAVETGDSWLILGVTAHTVTHLQTLPRGELPPSAANNMAQSFPALLSKALNRHAK